MTKYKKKTFEEKKKEVEQITEKMDSQIESYYETPEQMKEYLSFMSKFYNYSPNNIALIQGQFRGAKAVGSFKFWKEKGFSVQKGEKGITILAPNKTVPKYKNEEGKWKNIKYATVKEKELIKEGVLEKKDSRLYFGKGTVFDISQTNATADDLPEIFPNRWMEGEVEDYNVLYKAMERIADHDNVEIVHAFEELGASKGMSYTASLLQADGSFKERKEVTLNPRNSELQNVKTLVHELAHARLHTLKTHDNYSTEEKEFQAEMIAYAVCSNFGIDTSEYSLSYLASWTQGKDLKDKKHLLKEVNHTATDFIEIMEDEIIKDKNLQYENKIENESEFGHAEFNDKEYLLLEYGSLSSVITKNMSRKEIEKNILNGDRLKSVEFFNEQYEQKFTLVDPASVNEPKIVINWSEASGNQLNANEIIPFGKANKVMQSLANDDKNGMSYYKTRYSVLLPDDKGAIDVLAMDRLDIGDGYYKSPYEQIIKEKNLTESQLEKINTAIGLENTIYWYEMTKRPVSPGAQPKGFIEWKEDKGRHGIVGYERELTDKELDDFEMQVWDKNDKEKVQKNDKKKDIQKEAYSLER